MVCASLLYISAFFFAMGVSALLFNTKLSPDYVAGTFIGLGSESFIHNDYAFASSELKTSGNGGTVGDAILEERVSALEEKEKLMSKLRCFPGRLFLEKHL